jgi:hypothetical protein
MFTRMISTMTATVFSKKTVRSFFQRGRIALAALSLTACGTSRESSAPIQSTAEIWFHPLPAAVAWPQGNPNGGSTDFLGLFQANAPWPRAIAHTQVIGLYAGWITAASDQELQAVVNFLNAHNMGIEIEAPAMQALATCGSGVEGYVPYGQTVQTFTLGYLQRLQSFGAQVPFIKVDEPYFFGHVVPDPRSCNFSVQQIATEVGQYTQLVHTVYPNTAVGDVEPVITNGYVPDVVTALTQWHDTYLAVTGALFPFYFADIDFSNPTWPQLVKQLENSTRQRGLHFGIIYIGDMSDSSDAEWAGKVVARFQAYQGQNGGQPDYVLFQSWQPHPQFCLPETDPTTFTGVIDAYMDAIH